MISLSLEASKRTPYQARGVTEGLQMGECWQQMALLTHLEFLSALTELEHIQLAGSKNLIVNETLVTRVGAGMPGDHFYTQLLSGELPVSIS